MFISDHFIYFMYKFEVSVAEADFLVCKKLLKGGTLPLQRTMPCRNSHNNNDVTNNMFISEFLSQQLCSKSQSKNTPNYIKVTWTDKLKWTSWFLGFFYAHCDSVKTPAHFKRS